MFGANLECGIKAVKVKAQDVDGRIVRRCRVILSHEFTADIARELGQDAVQLRSGLRGNAIEKAVLPIENIAAIGAFSAANDSVEIGRMVGLKATAMKSKREDEGPTIQLEFEFSWDEDAWLFLGRHCNAMASVVLTKRQLLLAAGAETN